MVPFPQKSRLVLSIVSTTALVWLLPGSQSQSASATDYFEGQVVYTIIYSSTTPQMDLETLSDLRGNQMVMTFKEGNFKQEYYNAHGRPVQTSTRLIDEHRFYLEIPGLDTTYYSDTRFTGHTTQLNVVGNAVIAGYPCQEILSVAMPTPEYPHFEPVRRGCG